MNLSDSIGPAARKAANPRLLPSRVSRPGALFTLFAICFVLAVYVDLPLAARGIPMISAFPFACLAALILAPELISGRTLWLLFLALGLFGLSLLAPDTNEMLSYRVLAFGQMLYSIFVSLTLYIVIRRFSAAQIATFSRVFLWGLIAIMLLEIFTPLSSFMDTYITPLRGSGTLRTEITNSRDLYVGGGFRRPKAFTAETSHVAMAYVIGVCVLSWLTHRQHKLWTPALLAMIGVILLRSPIVLFAICFVGYCMWRRSVARTTSGAEVVFKASRYAIIAFPFAVLLLYAAAEIFAARLSGLGSGGDYSTTYRTYGSVLVAWNTIKEFPLFGVGIGSIDLARHPITTTYLSLGIPARIVMAEWRFQIQNLPSALLVYLGIVGTILYIGFMRFFILSISGRASAFFWLCILAIAATNSAFYSPKFNTYLFLLLAVNLAWNRSLFWQDQNQRFGDRSGEQRRARLRSVAAASRSRNTTLAV